MRRLLPGGALLLGTCMSSAAEVQFDEHTLCPAAVRAFDGKDSPAIREFLRFEQNVFDELDARYAEKGAPALVAKLTDKSLEVGIVVGYCRQHPTATIYEEAAHAYRGMRSLRTPPGSEGAEAPVPKQQLNEGTSRFRQ
jgi:hypothetical protein